jgi:hypothetical protein
MEKANRNTMNSDYGYLIILFQISVVKSVLYSVQLNAKTVMNVEHDLESGHDGLLKGTTYILAFAWNDQKHK